MKELAIGTKPRRLQIGTGPQKSHDESTVLARCARARATQTRA
jgi:hypothetical protein